MSVASIFDVIADNNRRSILDLLLQRPHLVGELVDALDISQPGVSKHLRVLRNAGLVNVRKDAQQRWYELQPEPLAEVDAWLSAYRARWEERFNNLDDYLLTMKDEDHENDDQEPDDPDPSG